MAYEKQTWVDGVTPLDAVHLNHMEDGIAEADKAIGQLTEKIPTDDHINEIIDTKLGVIENGSY